MPNTALKQTPTSWRTIAGECQRLTKILETIFPPQQICSYADFRADDLVMYAMIHGYDLETARIALSGLGLHIYGETPIHDAAGDLSEVLLDMVGYTVQIKLACMPEPIKEAA